jgi:hypothetical protein
MEPVANFVSTLFATRTQAHIFHLQTDSFAAHKALNEYYDQIIDLVDSYIESYQGRYGIITNYTSPSTFKEDGAALTYFEGVSTYIEQIRKRLPSDSYLQNKVDEIVDLVESTKYKLKFLH